MNRIVKSLGLIALLVALVAVPTMGQTTFASAPAPVTLQLNVSETLSVTTSAPGGIAALAPSTGGQYAAPSFNVTSTWAVLSTRTNLNVCQYLNQGNLPGSHTNYFSSVGGGAATTFNNTGSVACLNYMNANPGLVLGWGGPDVFSVGITSANLTGTNTTPVQISTQGLGAIPAGQTTGTLNYILIVN